LNLKRKQQEAVPQKIKFTDFRDAWVANSREFYRTRPKVMAIALADAAVNTAPVKVQGEVVHLHPMTVRIMRAHRRAA
jgi:hypothetical protein